MDMSSMMAATATAASSAATSTAMSMDMGDGGRCKISVRCPERGDYGRQPEVTYSIDALELVHRRCMSVVVLTPACTYTALT